MNRLLAALTVSLLVACNPADRPVHDPTGFENPIGKAVILQVISEAQAAYPDGVEAPLALGLGGGLRPASAPFLKSLLDAGHSFLTPEELDFDRVTKATVLKSSRTNPIVIQLALISQTEAGSHDIEAAWNRNRDIVRKTYRVTGDPDKGPLTIKETGVLKDERFPDDPRN